MNVVRQADSSQKVCFKFVLIPLLISVSETKPILLPASEKPHKLPLIRESAERGRAFFLLVTSIGGSGLAGSLGTIKSLTSN